MSMVRMLLLLKNRSDAIAMRMQAASVELEAAEALARAGVRDVIFPAENKTNVEEDLSPEQLQGVNVHYVTTIDEVLNLALPSSAAEVRKDAEEREHVIAGEPVHVV